MPFLFQVKIVSLNPKEKSAERKRAVKALSALKPGSLLCAQVYENSINGFENRLLVVTKKFDKKLESIGLAGIPEVFASRENYPKMLRLVERDGFGEVIALLGKPGNGVGVFLCLVLCFGLSFVQQSRGVGESRLLLNQRCTV